MNDALTARTIATDFIAFLDDCGVSSKIVRIAGSLATPYAAFIGGVNRQGVWFELTFDADHEVFVRRTDGGHVFRGSPLKAAAFVARMK